MKSTAGNIDNGEFMAVSRKLSQAKPAVSFVFKIHSIIESHNALQITAPVIKT